MRWVSRSVVLVCVHVGLMAFFLAEGRADAPAQKTPDPYASGMAAFQEGHYAKAIRCLKEFAQATVGDPRLKAANESLQKAWRGQAARLTQGGDPVGAARLLLDCAEYFQSGAVAEQAKSDARGGLETAFRSASKAKDYDQAVDIAVNYAKWFPDRPALADDQALAKMRLDAFVDLVHKKAGSDLVFARLGDLQERHIPEELLSECKPVSAACAAATTG